MKLYHPGDSDYAREFLFYTERKGIRSPMPDDNVRKMLRQYADSARASCPSMLANLHLHHFRHSRAMHLYQHGMDLALISQWLGHANLETTLIYAHADTEMKRKAIEKASAGICEIDPVKNDPESLDDDMLNGFTDCGKIYLVIPTWVRRQTCIPWKSKKVIPTFLPKAVGILGFFEKSV